MTLGLIFDSYVYKFKEKNFEDDKPVRVSEDHVLVLEQMIKNIQKMAVIGDEGFAKLLDDKVALLIGVDKRLIVVCRTVLLATVD